MYYAGREAIIADIFGAREVRVLDGAIDIDGRVFSVVDDIIVTLAPDRLPPRMRARIGGGAATATTTTAFADDIQFTFGEEWWEHGELLPEHRAEFDGYFDIVDLDALGDARVADLGCGSGRWAMQIADRCRELVVVDFSDAIFVARRNLQGRDNAIFVLGDVLDLPFRPDAFDLAYCLGVLHHLPVDALDACRRLAPTAPTLLIYLYYALDNRRPRFHHLLRVVTAVRLQLSRVRNRRFRVVVSWLIAVFVYAPLAWLGTRMPKRSIPLADTYGGKSIKRMQQDAYDRFFTRIEQRFSRADILTLRDTFDEVTFSDGLPYWHFLCRR